MGLLIRNGVGWLCGNAESVGKFNFSIYAKMNNGVHLIMSGCIMNTRLPENIRISLVLGSIKICCIFVAMRERIVFVNTL